ncbi:MAG: type II toxin-antitoxin system Phd/YefM family antitoxin [Terriglobales bacterium]
MKTASITDAKNNLSKLIDGLRGGPVVILDRGRPVARLEATDFSAAAEQEGRIADLERRGVLMPASEPLPRDFYTRPLVKLPKGASVLQALLEERDEGR